MAGTEVSKKLVSEILPKRTADTNKSDYGRVLIVSGSGKYIGAPFFCAQAAVNAGAGLVFLAHPAQIGNSLAAKLNEPIMIPLKQDELGFVSTEAAEKLCENINKYDVCLAGPGLGRSRGTKRIVKLLLTRAEIPLVLDADCLNELKDDMDLLKRARAKVVITPHEGEFKRLYPDFFNANREECAKDFSKKYGCITVLKGHRTVTALPDGEIFINTSGNPGMAKGGSGDVLAGVISSLIGQGIAPEQAAYIGVWLHGRAGDLSSEKFGEYGMTPTDMLSDIKFAIKECTI